MVSRFHPRPPIHLDINDIPLETQEQIIQQIKDLVDKYLTEEINFNYQL
jgi:hypothetical protein